MAFYAAAYVAIVLLLRARLRPFTPSLWLDGLIGLLTLGAISATLVLPMELQRSGRLRSSPGSSTRAPTSCCSRWSCGPAR